MKGTSYRNIWSNCHLGPVPSWTAASNLARYVASKAFLWSSKGWCLIFFSPALYSFLRSFSLIPEKVIFILEHNKFYSLILEARSSVDTFWRSRSRPGSSRSVRLNVCGLLPIQYKAFIITIECSLSMWFIIGLIWALWTPIICNTGTGISSECWTVLFADCLSYFSCSLSWTQTHKWS